MQDDTLTRPTLSPKNWGGWLSVGMLWLMGKLPQRIGLALSVPLAWLIPRLMKRRYHIAKRNVGRCFPELGEEQQTAIVMDCFRSLARSVFEIAWSWSASDRAILKMGDVQGLAHLTGAMQQGRGVLMVTAHMSCLEIGARILGCRFQDMKGMYRPLKSPVLEWYQTRGRSAYSQGMISKRDMRTAIRYIRKGGVLWYAPDQDFGPEQSAFVPFFGIQTATLLATHRMSKMTACPVVPMFPSYDADKRRYTVEILPAIEDFPGDDPVHDLARVNALMEAEVRKKPGQYWWIHRRFKSRPEGESPFYD
jgi:KDO2-lipid IV(A) lauroyltransferase